MKKLTVLLCAVLSAALLCSCGNPGLTDPGKNGNTEITEITLWTFPVGNWGNSNSVTSILMGFHKDHPNINVSVKYLNYETGDAEINEAAKQGKLPDLVLEGPERLVANWGVGGMMADLSDLWQSETTQTISSNIRNACRAADGKYYEVPICMTAHCMAINYNVFEAAGALEFLDKDENTGEYTHTWSTENFKKAVKAVSDYGKAHEAKYGNKVGEIYCGSQAGDQGTRALITNLGGGSFTNDEHTAYTVDSEKNKEALELLYSMKDSGIVFAKETVASEAISNFCKKDTAMCFCWSAAHAVQQITTNRDFDFKAMPMAFPTKDGAAPKLEGGIWGFGAFDNGSAERIAAAKTFIRYITENTDVYSKAVSVSSYWPVREIVNGTNKIDIYENDKLMTEYGSLMQYMGDYYQVMTDWQDARAAWWPMLAAIGDGEDVAAAIKDFPRKAA